ERVVLDLVPVPAGAVDAVGADLDQSTSDCDAVAQDLARDRAGGDAHRGLARARPAAAPVIADAVLGMVGEVGVARPELVLDRAVVARARIHVLDQKGDRRTRGLTLEGAGEDFDLVRLAPLRGELRLAGPAPVEPVLDVRLGERQ